MLIILSLWALIFEWRLFSSTDRTTRGGKPIGQILSLQNDGRAKGHSSLAWVKLYDNSLLYDQDWLFSGPGSSIQLSLDGGTQIDIGSETLVTLSQPNPDQASVEIQYGRAKVQASPRTRLEIKSKNQVILIPPNEDPKAFEIAQEHQLEFTALSENLTITTPEGEQTLSALDKFKPTKKAPNPPQREQVQAPRLEQKIRPTPPKAASNPLPPSNSTPQKIIESLVAPNLFEPFNRNTIYFRDKSKMLVVFAWEPSEDAESYIIQIAKDSKFENLLLTQKVNGLKTEYVFKNPTPFWWRVKAIYKNIESDWSKVFSSAVE